MEKEKVLFAPVYVASVSTESDLKTALTLYEKKKGALLVALTNAAEKTREALQTYAKTKKNVFYFLTTTKEKRGALPLLFQTASCMGYTHAQTLTADPLVEKGAKKNPASLLIDQYDRLLSVPLKEALYLLASHPIARGVAFETELAHIWSREKLPTLTIQSEETPVFTSYEKWQRFLAKTRVNCRAWQFTPPPWVQRCACKR